MGIAILLSLLVGADSLPSMAGEVRAEGARWNGPLPGAVVEVRQEGAVRRTIADPTGRYRLDGLRPGLVTVTVHHLAAHAFELDMRLPARGSVDLDLVLESRVVALPGVQVRAGPRLNRTSLPLPRDDPRAPGLALQALESSSGMAESGLISALAGDEARTSDRVFYMRGSTVDARMVFLDGAPVLTPFHVAGLVEPFDPDLLGGAELYLGGAPSPYEGGVSYLLDVDTRAARRDGLHGRIAADGISLRGSVEAPIPGNGGVLVGGRYLHGLQGTMGSRDQFPYSYEDLLVRAGWDVADGHALRVTGFHNREGVRLDMIGPSPARGSEAHWGNQAGSLRYEGGVGTVRLEGTAAASRYNSVLPVLWDDPVLAAGVGDRTRVAGQAVLPRSSGALRVGGSWERIAFRYRLQPLDLFALAHVSHEEEVRATSGMGLFAEWEGEVSPGLELRAGVRADYFAHERRTRLGPRVALRFALGERATLFASAGGYHQVMPASGLRSRLTEGRSSETLGWEPALPVVSASHVVVGLEQEFDRSIALGFTGFVKGFSGLGNVGSDRSRASGTELRVNWSAEHVRMWMGYALSWFWIEEGSVGSTRGSTRFDGRHLLSLGAAGALPGGVEVLGTLGYGAGLPLTSIDLDAPEAGVVSDGFRGHRAFTSTDEHRLNTGGGVAPLDVAPQDAFLRLDLEVGWPREIQMGGRATQLRPYLKVLNALDRRDAHFYYFDRWREEEARPLARRPFLPLAGLEWRF